MPPQRSAEACAADGGYLYTARTASRRMLQALTAPSCPSLSIARDGSTLPGAVDEERDAPYNSRIISRRCYNNNHPQ